MAATVAVFDSLHSGPLHCVEFDFFASRLATASSDRTIRLWHVHPQSNDRQQQLVQASPGSLPHELLIDGAAGRGSGGVGRGGTSTAAKATLLQELHAHEGPVWQVRWAHPSFGNILASCGYDKRIVVWQQEQRHGGGYGAASFGGYGLSQEPGTGGGAGSSPSVPFVPVYSNEDHAASVNALAFAPPEWGLMLAAGSSDGSISVLMHFGEGGVGTADLDTDAAADRVARAGWTRQAVFSAHFNGVYAVAWAPACPLPLQGEEAGGEEREGYETADVPTADSAMPMLASGGADCQVRIWGLDRRINSWRQLQQLKGSSPHTDWVRDVAFQPASAAALLLPSALLLASCSEDSTVKLWVYDPPSETRTTFRSSRPPGSRKPQWRLLQTLQLHAPVWRIAWSASGTLLAAACGDEDVALFRESVSGVWETVSKISGPPPMQMLSGIQLQEDQQQQQQTFQEEAVQQRGIQEHGVQQGLQQRRLSQQGLQQPGLHQQGLQQPELQQHGLQQHGMQQRSMQEPPAAQHASTPGLQGAPLRLQQVLGPQQQPLQMQTPQQQPQPLNMSLRYPRPQGAQQQQQQQATPPISLFPPSQRPPSMQEPPLTKQMQQQGMAGSAPYEGAGFPGGPYPAPGGGVQGMRPQQQQVGQIQPSKAPVSPIPCTRGPSVVSQQAAPGAPGTAGSTPQPFAASNCPVPLPGPLHLVAAPARQQSFPQQPLSQQQPQALQQQAPQQHQGPPGTLVTGGGAPPLPPSFISAPHSHSTPGVPTQSGLPPVGPMQQPRTGVNVNPFQVYQTGGAPVPPSQQPHQQPGMTRAHLLTPPPPTGAGLTPPVSMQQHAFASGGARQQQSLYTPYKTN